MDETNDPRSWSAYYDRPMDDRTYVKCGTSDDDNVR